MYWLIVTRIAITVLTQNGQVTAGPETTITLMSSQDACNAAAAAVHARAIGNFRVFADCVAQ
jgi:hypothetical protein